MTIDFGHVQHYFPFSDVDPRQYAPHTQFKYMEVAMSESECICGCGEITRGGRFRPGHDQKLRKAIEDAVGGLESLRAIAEAHVKRPITTSKQE